MVIRRNVHFTEGNQLTLLTCGDAFFPALITAMESAQSELFLETYLFSDDITGNQVEQALCRAAQRGVSVHVIVDWLGTGHQRSMELGRTLQAAGVHFRCFNPWFRHGITRTHRKLFVADRRIAMIGGINITHDLLHKGHSQSILPFPRWDFAVTVQGPLVNEIHELMQIQWQRLGKISWSTRLGMLKKKIKPSPHLHTPILACLAPRDNLLYRSTIQKAYLEALDNAKDEVLLVTPYFAPSRTFRNALINAAQRGVRVTLLIGYGDFALQDAVAHSYYPKLLNHGVRIVEYHKSQLHAKVAVIDRHWCTIGSSNCDGLSLFINQEANILIKDHTFSVLLSDAIQIGIDEGVNIHQADYNTIRWYRRFWYGCAFFIYSAIMRVIAIEGFM